MSLQARLARLERTRRPAGAWRGYEWPEKTADDLAREWAAVACLGDTLGLLPFACECPPPPAGGAGSITAWHAMHDTLNSLWGQCHGEPEAAWLAAAFDLSGTRRVTP
jgi:hypothetical protein